MLSIGQVTTKDHREENTEAVLEAVQHIHRLTSELAAAEALDCRIRFSRADWLIHLSQLLDYGEIGEILDELGISEGLARQEMWVARKISPERRQPDLMTWTAHRSLAGQGDDVYDSVVAVAKERHDSGGQITTGEVDEIIEANFPPEPVAVNVYEQTREEYVFVLVNRDLPRLVKRIGRRNAASLIERILRFSQEYTRGRES